MSTLPELPYIPLEVGENIIDQLIGHVDSLRSCALTCRGWSRHARYHLLTSIGIQSTEDLYSIRDYITSNPRMASFVRRLSMSIPITDNNVSRSLELDILPVDLLRRLPNLQIYSIANKHWTRRSISFHATTLMHIKTYLLVGELHLGPLEFCTNAELARLLIALPRLRRLECEGTVNAKEIARDTARYRDKCSRLSEVTIRRSIDVPTLALIVQVPLSTLNILRYHLEDEAGTLELSQLKHLHYLELVTAHRSLDSAFDQILPVVTTLSPDTLRGLTITFTHPDRPPGPWLGWTTTERNHAAHSLEDALLGSGTTSLVVHITNTKRNKFAFWSKSIHECFPRLHDGDLLQVQCSSGDIDEEIHYGHDQPVEAMAASPDGRYVATIAHDFTVIVWSVTTFPQRILISIDYPETLGSIRSLEFSDIGEFLVGMWEHDLRIWRVVDGVEITSIALPADRHACAWRRLTLDSHTLSVFGSGLHESSGFSHLWATTAHVHQSGTVTTSAPVSLFPDNKPAVYNQSLAYNLVSEPVDHCFSLSSQPSSTLLCAGTHNSEASACYFWRIIASTGAYEMYELEIGHPDLGPFIECACFVGDTGLVVGFCNGIIRWWDISSFPPDTAEPRGVRVSLFPAAGYIVDSLLVSPRHSFLVALPRYCMDLPPQQELMIPILRRTSTRTAQGRFSDDFTLHVALRGHTNWVDAVCFSPCERYIATASRDHTVRMWSTRDGELLWTFRDHGTSASVRHVVFSPDGKMLCSADNTGEVIMRLLAMFVRDVRLPVSTDDTEVLNARLAELDF